MNILAVHLRFSKLSNCQHELMTTYYGMQCMLRRCHAQSGLHQVAPTCSKRADCDMLTFTGLSLAYSCGYGAKVSSGREGERASQGTSLQLACHFHCRSGDMLTKQVLLLVLFQFEIS